jgi:succinate dehydrogenase flavin-adding protein (antitoxin of CptAB toxin-antitoxin module)
MTTAGTPRTAIPRDADVLPPVGVLTTTELNRLRWRCRRGMLENDLILARYLAARGTALSAADVAGLDRLLSLTDNELWDLLSGRVEPDDVALAPMVAALRAA